MSGHNASYIAAFGGDGTATSYNIVSNVSQYTPVAGSYNVNGFAIDQNNIKYFNNRAHLNSYAGTFSSSTFLWLGYFMGSGSGVTDATDITTDWVLVRKFASSTPTVATSTEEIGPGPVAYWKFDEGQGTTTVDSTVNRLNGTFVTTAGSPTWKTESECVVGKCLDFDGSDDYAETSASAKLDIGTSVTLSAWINRRTNAIDYESIVNHMKKSASYDGYWIGSMANGKIMAFVGPYTNTVYTTNTISNNAWHHVALVSNGTNFAIYVDGVKASADQAVGSITTTGVTARIGRSDTAVQIFDGKIDEVKIYPYARTADQIVQDYNAGLAGISSPKGASVAIGSDSPKWMTDGLVGHWKMDEASTTVVADASGNGNNGTLTNAQETGTSDATGNSTTTMIDTDGSLSTTDDAYNGMVLRFTSVCGSITSGTERTISDYTGASKTFTVAELNSSANSCAYEIRHQTAGKFGNGLGFDGVNDYAEVTLPDLSINYSVSFWLKLDESGREQHPIEFSSTQFFISSGLQTWFQGYGNTILELNKWYHIVYMSDSQGSRIYLNGKLDKRSNITYDPSTTLAFGDYYGHTGNYDFNGMLDDVRVYNRALSPDEVSKLAEYGPGPTGYWKFDEGRGGNTYDSSGYGHNGTLYNNPLWTEGKYGSALQFDGSSSYVSVGGSTSDYGPRSMDSQSTVEAWIKLDFPLPAGNHTMTSNLGGLAEFYVPGAVNPARIYGFCYGVPAGNYWPNSVSSVVTGLGWQHVAWVRGKLD